jgi:GAF domain-containing protein
MMEESLMTEEKIPTTSAQNQPGDRRLRMIRRTYIISILFLLVTIVDSFLQFNEFGAWQILADAAGIIGGLVLLIFSFVFFLRENHKTASTLIPFVIITAYAPGDLFLEGVTVYNLLSGILIFILAYFIFRPKNTNHWLRMVIAHVVLVIAFSSLNLFTRFDITVSPSWQISLPIFTILISVLILWQIIANYQIRSIQSRLLIILIGLGFVPTLIASFTSITIIYQRDIQQAQNYLETVSNLKLDQIDSWVDQIREDVRDLENGPEFVDNVDFLINFTPPDDVRQQIIRDIRSSIQSFIEESDRYTQVEIIDSEGTILVSSNDAVEGVSISSEDGFSLGQNETYLSPLSIDTFTQTPYISVYHPLTNEQGDPAGMVVGRLNPSSLIESVSETVQLGETGEAYLVSQERLLISPLRNAPDLGIGVTTLQTQATTNALNTFASATLRYNNYAGEAVVGAYTWIPELKSVLILEQSEQEAFQSLRLNLFITSAIAILTLAVTITIATITARNLSEPIQTLSQDAARVWKGELSHIEPLDRQDEIGELSITLSLMTSQLLETTENLEDLVADRTKILDRRSKYLETNAQISRAIAAIYNIDNLLNTVVHLISDNFGFYHAGIFLVDDSRKFAVLRAASSEGGWRMLARDHKLEIGKQGIVGYVTGTGESRIQQRVAGEDSIYYDNPDLPLTKSEMALPLKVGNEILGALDVQSIEEQAFSQEDVSVLQGLADAITVAIQNTRLVQQLQESLKTERRIYGDITREAWISLLTQQDSPPAFRADLSGTQLVATPSSLTGRKALESGQTTIDQPDEDNSFYAIAVPVRIRGGVRVGVIETKKPLNAGEWTREEISILENVSADLGVALENARLFEDTQRKAQRDRLSAELASKIWASSDVENILQTAVKELGSALQVSRGTIKLTLPEESEKQSDGAKPS